MKETKYTCGMYGGSFNPLHIGHVRCMLQAANLCRRLIVVISAGSARNEIDISLRYRWVYETVRHFPNISLYVLKDDAPDKGTISEAQWLEEARGIKEFAGEPIEAVFCGSDYGNGTIWQKCYPEAQIVVFPRDGISSTAIRQAPLRHWDDMPAHVRTHFVKKVLILGTESTGKSMMAVNLARYFNTVYLEEVGREISQRSGTDRWMLPEDFTDILLQHKVKQKELIAKANRVFFEDTNCFTTDFYIRYLNDRDQQRNHALAEAIAELNDYDLVLLLKPTVPFVQDGDRSIEDAMERERCTEWLDAICRQHGLAPAVIAGADYHSRFMTAVKLVEGILNE